MALESSFGMYFKSYLQNLNAISLKKMTYFYHAQHCFDSCWIFWSFSVSSYCSKWSFVFLIFCYFSNLLPHLWHQLWHFYRYIGLSIFFSLTSYRCLNEKIETFLLASKSQFTMFRIETVWMSFVILNSVSVWSLTIYSERGSYYVSNPMQTCTWCL